MPHPIPARDGDRGVGGFMFDQPAPGEEFRHYTHTLGPAVMMDSHREGSRADTLWTFGLCG